MTPSPEQHKAALDVADRPAWMNTRFGGSDGNPEKRDADLVSMVDALAERVAKLEQALHGKIPRAGETASGLNAIPAWQRAMEGDRVQYLHRIRQTEAGVLRIGTVIMVADTNATQRICVTPEGETNFCWPVNSDIVAVLPPEPAAPVQAPPTEKLKAAYALYQERIEPEPKDLADLKAHAIDGRSGLWTAIVQHIGERGVVSADRINAEVRTILDQAYNLGLAHSEGCP